MQEHLLPDINLRNSHKLIDLANFLALYGKDAFLCRYKHPFLVVRRYPSRPTVLTVEPTLETASMWPSHLKSGLRSSCSEHPDFPRLRSALELAKSKRSSMSSKITIGRTSHCDVSICDSGVSRLHAVFTKNSDHNYYIADWGSTNGTFLNNIRLKSKKAMHIKSGDQLAFHHHRFEFFEAPDLANLLARLFEAHAN